MFRVNHLLDELMDDIEFEDKDDAGIFAADASIDDDVWGVWDVDTDELVLIAYGLITFEPV